MSAHYVYRCFDSTGRLIYVGSTADLWSRLANHAQKAWWAYQVAKVTGRVHCDKPTALAAERLAIASEGPRWNVMGRWASRFGWTAQDYTDYYLALRKGISPNSKASLRHQAKVAAECRTRFDVEVAEDVVL